MQEYLLTNFVPRTRVQRVGLVVGLIAFTTVLLAPAISGFVALAAKQLNLPLDHSDVLEAARGAQATLALTLLMVSWWMTEAVPIPITALLPGIMLPLLHVTGISGGHLYAFTNTASFAGYASPVIYLFLAGFLLAGAMRKSGLDRRITLTLLSWKPVIRGPSSLVFSVMAVTAFLSLWISNTATTAMMLPIAVGVLHELGEKPGRSALGGAMMLGVAWAASIGGIGTIMGSPPNGIVVGILAQQHLIRIDFMQWMTMGIPVAVLGVVTAWLWLMAQFRPKTFARGKLFASLDQQRHALGSWTHDEVATLAVFVLVVVLWISRPFWKYLVGAGGIEQISRFGVYEIGVACSLLLFIIPVERRTWRPVLDWRDNRYVDWGTLILFGGGIALSNAMLKTGLTDWLAGGLIGYLGWATPWVALGAVVLLVDFLTEITSNTAVTTMMTPILIVLAPKLGLHPVLLCVAAAMASSLAFMLPVATPPNALVYGTGYFRVGQMIRAGFLMNFAGCLLLVASLYAITHLLPGVLE